MQNTNEHIVPIDRTPPYQRAIFKTVWGEHFHPGKEAYEFKFFKGVSFFKKGRFPLFINIGATNTKGIYYETKNGHSAKEMGANVYLLYDVPNHIPPSQRKIDGLRLKAIPQYEGFICNLTGMESVEEYLRTNLSKRSRSKLRNYTNKLYKNLDVSHKMIWGDISKDIYVSLFERFHQLLVQRFEDKQTVNNNLDPIEWNFFKDLTLPMLRDKQAGLFVTYLKDKPITITLLNFSDGHAYDVIRVFDIDLARYRIGSIGIVNQLEWCINNNFKVLDFSKGYYDYKKRWSTDTYMMHYHLWYNPKNPLSWSFANFLAGKFKLKFWARKKGLLKTVHQVRFRMMNKL